jgi:hypothetical protein
MAEVHADVCSDGSHERLPDLLVVNHEPMNMHQAGIIARAIPKT